MTKRILCCYHEPDQASSTRIQYHNTEQCTWLFHHFTTQNILREAVTISVLLRHALTASASATGWLFVILHWHKQDYVIVVTWIAISLCRAACAACVLYCHDCLVGSTLCCTGSMKTWHYTSFWTIMESESVGSKRSCMYKPWWCCCRIWTCEKQCYNATLALLVTLRGTLKWLHSYCLSRRISNFCAFSNYFLPDKCQSTQLLTPKLLQP